MALLAALAALAGQYHCKARSDVEQNTEGALCAGLTIHVRVCGGYPGNVGASAASARVGADVHGALAHPRESRGCGGDARHAHAGERDRALHAYVRAHGVR